MKVTDALNEYFELMKRKPEAFLPSSEIEIVTDRETLENYAKETKKELGVVYKSPYNTLVVDLVKSEGRYFRYERVIPSALGRGTVCVPMYKGKFLLINQYRHPIRAYQLCFPRGFGEDGLSAFENAKKELAEEIGATVEKTFSLGEVSADSGLSFGIADVVLCEVSSYETQEGYEGIVSSLELSPDELKEKISKGEINDGFTLSAFALYEATKNKM